MLQLCGSQLQGHVKEPFKFSRSPVTSTDQLLGGRIRCDSVIFLRYVLSGFSEVRRKKCTSPRRVKSGGIEGEVLLLAASC